MRSPAWSPAPAARPQRIHRCNFTREQERERASNALVDEGLAQFFVEVQAHHAAVAQHVHRRDAVVEPFHAQVAVVVQRLAVVAEDAVAVLETDGFEFGVDVDGVFVGEFGLTPNKQHP